MILNVTQLQTKLLGIGESFSPNQGCRQIDILNQGTSGDVTFTGQKGPTNDALPIPPGYSYSTGFNTNGYAGGLVITNNSDAVCAISIFW